MMWRDGIQRVLLNCILPLGLFCVLTGMLWLNDHGRFPKLYLLFALPTLALFLIEPAAARRFISVPIVTSFVVFAGYLSATIAWSGAEERAVDLLKRPLLVLVLFFGITELGRHSTRRLYCVVTAAAILALGMAAYEIVRFAAFSARTRLASDGALQNPLLISHVFGFFAALWLGWMFTRKDARQAVRAVPAIVLLLLLLVLTGSRTPLLAVAITLAWLTALNANGKNAVLLATFLGAGGLLAALMPEMITQRGFSYRPQIWAEAVAQIQEQPLLGYGYGTPLHIKLTDLEYAFHDPHNLSLAVLYDGGIVGLTLWVSLYTIALTSGWRLRHEILPTIYSATVVYGLVAGMTEGGAFLTRPKEHWFLIWIPLALLASSTLKETRGGQGAA